MASIEAATDRYRAFLAVWLGGVCRYAAVVLCLAVVATAGATYLLATNLRINTDNEDMLSAGLPFRQDSRALSEAFPQFSDNILVVIDGETPDLADDAASMLAARLRQRPDVFGQVFDPAGDPFFRRNGLLYLDPDELAALADRLAQAQPFLAALWSDPSLRGFFEMLELAIDNRIGQDERSDFPITRVLDAVAAVVEALAADRFAELSWQGLMTGDETPAVHRRILQIQPVIDFATLRPAALALAELRKAVAELRLVPEAGVTVRFTGSAALNHEELESVETGMGRAGLISLALVLLLLVLAFRSFLYVAAELATLVMGLAWTAAFAILAIGTFNLISVAFAVLFIGLSVDFGIHYVLRFEESLAAGRDREAALQDAGTDIGGALSLCAVCAAIAFYSFAPTDYRGLAELGVIAGTGMFIALFANLTVLPAILQVLPGGSGGRIRRGSVAPRASSVIVRHAGKVRVGALCLAAAAAMALPSASFDFDPLNLKDPRTESVSTLMDLANDPRTSPYLANVLATDLAEADQMAARLRPMPEVDAVATLTDLLPSGQDEKLEIIADMALFLAPSLAGGRVAGIDDSARRRAVVALAPHLNRLARSGTAAEVSAAKRLQAALTDLMTPERNQIESLRLLEARLLARLPGRVEALRASLEAEPVTFESLPPHVAAHYLATNGRARLTVFPAEDLRDRAALQRFVAAVRAAAPRATGAPVVILEAGEAVLAAFAQAGLTAVVCIALLLALLVERWRDVLLVFAPLVLAALLSCGVAVLLGLRFNYANIIVLPLLFGLGVASALHIVWREHAAKVPGGAFATSTPRAVLFSALTTIGSFASIGLSSHPGTASMGVLLTLAITLTVACTLVLLPALMASGGDPGTSTSAGA